jgi:hypothetical protein
MRKIYSLLLLMAATMMAWTSAYAQTDAEYEAALAAIQENGVYYVKSDVGGTYYYLKGDGTLTATQADAAKFIFQKFAITGGFKEVGFKLNNNNTYFSNPPGTNESNLACGHINTSTRQDNHQFEAQVFFLNTDLGKYAVRAGNTPEATSGWSWVAGSYWTIVGDVDPVAQYQWAADYRWELEIDATATEQYGAHLTVQAWPLYIQSVAGLVKDPAKFVSNAKESSEGSYEALLDNVYTTFFHSSWSASVGEAHYLQAELSQATQKFEFYFKKRSQNNNNRPTVIVISASNDGENFTDITTLDSGFPTDAAVIDYLSSVIDLGASYKYVRFTVTETNSGGTNSGGEQFFTFSEFYIFPGVDAAAQVAAVYNQLSGTPWNELTPEQVAQVNRYDTLLKAVLSSVNVTYELYEADGELVASRTVVQQPGSPANPPLDFVSGEKFYTYEVTGTVGATDCTIKITRTLKPEVVGALAELSNNKAYTVACDRGALLTTEGYLASTNHSSLLTAEAGQFAILSYEGNYYVYSVADGKFVTNNGSLADSPTNGKEDAMVMDPQTVPYFLWHFNATDKVLNTNGNDPYGYVINNYNTPDPGNQYYMIEAADFDPTNAIAALDKLFHPAYSVIYKVKDAFGNIIFTSDPEPAEQGDVVTTLPEKYHRAFYTYDEVNVTVETAGGTDAVFTATWEGPFELSADFASARWYNMTMRGNYYVTSAEKDEADGAYVTQQNAPKGSLVEDSYQWAFTGNGYQGIKILNKAEGEGKSFGWTDANQKDAGIPTVLADTEGNHAWNIVSSTNTTVPAGSFVLNVAGTNLYPNQYGGAGRPMKFWNSANNVGDPGAAFTVYDVPSYAEVVTDEIAPYFEGKYFVFTDEAKAEFGYEPAYKEECSFETYQELKEKMTPDFLSDMSNYVMPETGIYFMKNLLYGTYMGIDPSDANMYGNYKKADQLKHYVTLIKTGEFTYKIGLMGKNAPSTVSESAQVTADAEDAGEYTVVITTPGYAAFQANTEDNMSALHCAGGGSIVGWEPTADASKWAVEDATSISLAVSEAGYATAYLPFPVEIGQSLAIPEAIGTWTFDDGTTGTLTANAGANGDVTVADGVATVPAGANLSVEPGIEDPNTYTFMMDVKVVNEDNGRYTSLFMSGNDREDGGLFIFNHKTNGRRIGINMGQMGYGGSYELDTWYRVVFSCENGLPTVYVDGQKVVAATATIEPRLHWTLSDVIYFFADNDGEENEVQADQIRLWDIALSADEVALLGAYGDPEPEASSVVAYTGVIKDGSEGVTPGDYKFLLMSDIGSTIPAYTPVVLKGEPSVYEFTIPEVEVDPEGDLRIIHSEVDGSEALAKEETEPIENDLKGTLEPIDAAGLYVLALENDVVGFYKAEDGKIAAGKAYLEVPEGSEIRGFVFTDEGATGIQNLNELKSTSNAIYNVAGQRLSKMQKGVNIVNGKKILY